MMDDKTSRVSATDASETVDDLGSGILDQLAEEFADRCRKGDSPSIAEYEARYPEYVERIRKLFPTVAMMEQLKRDDRSTRSRESAASKPERLGDFRVVRELGRGGMGIVYEAVQESLGRHVALKVIHHVHINAKRLERFQREARAVAKLHHTNIVAIFGVGEHEGLPFYAMQYIQGNGLDVLLSAWRQEDKPRSDDHWRFAARVGVQAAEALQYAHDQGILHRDVKPANLLIDEQQTAWLTDFGLAKLAGQDDLTASGDVIGTLRYLAPESLHGETDGRSDVYSLGLTLYEMLTLKPPFGEASASELLRQVSEGEPTRPRRLDPAIPGDLETIVLKAISREPGHRYASAGALADDLNRFLEDRPIQARPANAIERLWRWGRRNRATAALTATAAASLLLAAVVGLIGYASTARALRRADENVALSLAVFEELFEKLAPQDNSLPPPTGHSRPRQGPPGSEPDYGPLPFEEGGRRPPPPPLDGGGNPFGPDGGPPGEPPRPGGPGGPRGNTALLQSVLTFYERFAERNETNSRLKSESARAYSRVASLYERLGRADDSAKASAHAQEVLEGLIKQYPTVQEYRSRLVDLGIRTDPWLAPLETLPRIRVRLERARVLVDQLTRESPENTDYVESQLHVHAKLGAIAERMDQPEDAEEGYRRAIELAGSLIDQSSSNLRARVDRIDMRDALARLLIEQSKRDEALKLVEATSEDLSHLAGHKAMDHLLANRFQSLSEVYRSLGQEQKADAMAEQAARATEHKGRGFGPRDRGGRPPIRPDSL